MEPMAEKIAANMMTTTTIPTIIGSSGTMAHTLDICLSLSSRVRRSRLRFSSGMLNWGCLLDRSLVQFFYLRQWSFVPTGHARPFGRSPDSEVGQSLNDWELSVFILCGRGLAWSMISACQCMAQQIADDPGNRLNSGSGLQIPAAAPIRAKPRQRRTKILKIGLRFEPKGWCAGTALH